MLENILNKKVNISVAFESWMGGGAITSHYKGVVVAYDDNFIMFDNGNLVNIKYIQVIEVL